MGRNSGGVLSSFRGGGESFAKDVRKFVKGLYGSRADYSKMDDKRLKQLIKKGKTYKQGDLEKAIINAIKEGKRLGGNFGSGNYSGIKSEIIRQSNLKKIHDAIPKYQEILKRRKNNGKK